MASDVDWEALQTEIEIMESAFLNEFEISPSLKCQLEQKVVIDIDDSITCRLLISYMSMTAFVNIQIPFSYPRSVLRASLSSTSISYEMTHRLNESIQEYLSKSIATEEKRCSVSCLDLSQYILDTWRDLLNRSLCSHGSKCTCCSKNYNRVSDMNIDSTTVALDRKVKEEMVLLSYEMEEEEVGQQTIRSVCSSDMLKKNPNETTTTMYTSTSTPRSISRSLIYFHHIKSPMKKKEIVSTAAELSLSGLWKEGFPGIVIIEDIS